MGYRMNLRIAMVVIATTAFGCALFQSTAKTVIDVALATCIAEHPDVDSPEAMQKVCPYVESLGPIVRDLLGARKRGLARVAAQRMTDAGPDASAQDAGK